MQYVYLIGSIETSLYKIGVTSDKNLSKRLAAIQTGCPYKVEIIDKFPTDIPYKVEGTIHRTMCGSKQDGNGVDLHGEWFYLGLEEVYKFKDKCILTESNLKLIDS